MKSSSITVLETHLSASICAPIYLFGRSQFCFLIESPLADCCRVDEAERDDMCLCVNQKADKAVLIEHMGAPKVLRFCTSGGGSPPVPAWPQSAEDIHLKTGHSSPEGVE